MVQVFFTKKRNTMSLKPAWYSTNWYFEGWWLATMYFRHGSLFECSLSVKWPVVKLPGDLCSRCSRWESEKKTCDPFNWKPVDSQISWSGCWWRSTSSWPRRLWSRKSLFNQLANNFYHRLFVTKPWVACLVQQALVNSEGLCGKGPRCWVNSFRLSYHHHIIMEG